jgi:hypothetical protein
VLVCEKQHRAVGKSKKPRHPRQRTARGRCGSLLLHRIGLAPTTHCRSPGAHCERFWTLPGDAAGRDPPKAMNPHLCRWGRSLAWWRGLHVAFRSSPSVTEMLFSSPSPSSGRITGRSARVPSIGTAAAHEKKAPGTQAVWKREAPAIRGLFLVSSGEAGPKTRCAH